jgi:hypothetical protein
MQLRLPIVGALGLGLGSLAGCGGAGAVNFFDAVGDGAGGSASLAGMPNVVAGASNGSAGAPSVVGGAPSGAGGAPSGAGGGSAGTLTVAGAGSGGVATTDPVDEAPCDPVLDITDNANMSSGEFQTKGPVCLLVSDDIVGWGCSNFAGRTVKVNGVQVRCAELPLPDKLRGAYYFDVSAGDFPYASMYWY